MIIEPPHVATVLPDNRDVMRRFEMARSSTKMAVAHYWSDYAHRFVVGHTMHVTLSWANKWADPECD